MRAVLLGVALLLPACNESPAPRSDAPPPPAKAPAAANTVKPFALGQPDVVLLVSGGTHGMLELCECPAASTGGLARRSSLAAAYRHAIPHTLMVDLGDALWVDPMHLRNRYVLRGYRQLPYDVLVLGDQEWAVPAAHMRDVFAPGELTYLSTTVRSRDANDDPPLTPVVRREFGEARLAILSHLPREEFWFVNAQRVEQLDFTPPEDLARRIAALQAESIVVVLVHHGTDATLKRATAMKPDLILRGHSARPGKPVREVEGVPVIDVGDWQVLAAIALRCENGKIADLELRWEPVDLRWAENPSMFRLYREYLAAEQWARSPEKLAKSIEYVGADRCASCHTAEHEHWKQSAHARAHAGLARIDRQDDRRCLRCHTTAFELPGGFASGGKTPHLANVTCQSCHLVNLDEAGRHGTVLPVTEESCASCHTPLASPTFEYRTARRTVSHSRDEGGEAK